MTTPLDTAALLAAHAAVSFDDTIECENVGSGWSPLDRPVKECREFYKLAHAAVPALLDENKHLREALAYLRRKVDGYDTTFAYAEAYAAHGEQAVESGAVEVNCD